jgi:hypothetical protein
MTEARKPRVNSEGHRELEKVEDQINKFSDSVSTAREDRASLVTKEVEPQTKLSQEEMNKSKIIYLKPKRTFPSREKFNEKYDSVSLEQKQILKEFINSVDSAPHLREFYNTKIAELKEHLSKSIKAIQDPATKVKVEEISKQLIELDKTSRVNDDHLVDLMQYYELVQEIKKANGVQI